MERERAEEAQQKRRSMGKKKKGKVEVNCVKTFAEGGDRSERVNQQEMKERRAITE